MSLVYTSFKEILWAFSIGELLCAPFQRGGFHLCSPFQHCNGKHSVHTPRWQGSVTLEVSKSRTVHRKCIQLIKTIEIHAENSTLRLMSGSLCQETVISSSHLQNRSCSYPQTHLPPNRGSSSMKSPRKFGRMRKTYSFRKGQTRKVMSLPQLMNGEAREGAAGSKLGVCSHTFQMHIHMFIPSQIAGCLIHSVSSIIRSWDGLTVLLFAWEAKRVLNAVMSPTAQASFELLGVHLLSSFGNCEPDNTDYCLCVRYQAKEKYKLHLQKVSCPSTLVFRAHRL